MKRDEAEVAEFYSWRRKRDEMARRKQSSCLNARSRAATRAAGTPNGDRHRDEDTSIDEMVANAITEEDSTLTQSESKDDFHKRSVIDQQAALNLAQFAQSNNDINLGGGEIENLLNILIVSVSFYGKYLVGWTLTGIPTG